MFKNYLKPALRNPFRAKFLLLVDIFGLAGCPVFEAHPLESVFLSHPGGMSICS